MTERDAVAALTAAAKAYRTQTDAAAAFGISHSYLCDILRQRRHVPDRVLAQLQLERVIVIRRKKAA